MTTFIFTYLNDFFFCFILDIFN